MLNIKFKNKELSFWQIERLSQEHKLNKYELLASAFNQHILYSEETELLKNFILSLRNISHIVKSQIFQDAFAHFIISQKYEKSFLEFGATNGLDLSNTFLLENNMNWSGVVAEPSPQWHMSLEDNRPKAKILKKCIWKSSGDKLKFFMSDLGALSTLNDFTHSDETTLPQNTALRIKSGRIIEVNTISLNDVMKEYFNDKAPSYISVDTEGSEFEILSSFDFKKYKPIFFSVEHNFTNLESKIDDLMISNGYFRVFKKLTSFDAWYLRNDII